MYLCSCVKVAVAGVSKHRWRDTCSIWSADLNWCVLPAPISMQISQLHRPAAAYAAEDPAADVATSKKLNLLSRGPQAVQPASQQQDQQPLPFCWSSIIWTQALQHSNLQVGWVAACPLHGTTLACQGGPVHSAKACAPTGWTLDCRLALCTLLWHDSKSRPSW